MGKNVVVIDGGPRKGWNTAQLLQSATDGAIAAGADVQCFRLYDLDFRGCTSCFACKLKEGAVTLCAMRDALRPVLKAVHSCDVLVLGSPIYWHEVTGEMRSMIERLLYPCISYDHLPGDSGHASRFGRDIKVAMFFTAGAVAEMGRQDSVIGKLEDYKTVLSKLLGPTEYRFSSGTWQFEDYSRYATGMFDVPATMERHNTVFSADKQAAYDLLASLVG
jgi:multimeric flavodoxin WrbA